MPNISVKMFIHRKMPPTKNISSQWERDSIERLLRPSKLNYSKHAFYSMKEVWKSNFHDDMDKRKNRGGKSQRREGKKKDQRRDKGQKKSRRAKT
jgi:hypothetical protein